jgi:hypothetical protein
LSIGVPVDAVVWTDFAPAVFSGVNLALPADGMVWSDFVPDIELGDIIPTDSVVWTDYAPVIAAGAHIEVPGDALAWADFALIVSISATVPAPADAMEWEDYAPVVVSGAGMEFPADETVWEDYAPLIASGVNLAIPSNMMAWRDFGVVAGYGFSAGFSSGFNSLPSAAGATVPVDTMWWADSAPTVEAETAAEVEYLGLSAFASASTSHTIAVPFGNVDERRKIIVAVHIAAGPDTGPVLSSPSIGGVAATVFEAGTIAGVNDVGVRWIGAEVPSGASGNVQLTFNTSTAVRLGVWRLVSGKSLAKIDSDVLTWNGSGATRTVTTNTLRGCVQFAAASILFDGGSFSFTSGITSSGYNQSITGSSTARITGGFELISADEADRPITLTKSGGAENWRGALVAFSI